MGAIGIHHQRLYPSIHQIKGWNLLLRRGLRLCSGVSIHQSIKSRVETTPQASPGAGKRLSLSINPSNQGLKRTIPFGTFSAVLSSLSINPSNQGLKLGGSRPRIVHSTLSLSINPSNQGLKLKTIDKVDKLSLGLYPSIHQIKGWNDSLGSNTSCPFSSLSINPSNQGLKPRS